MSQALKKLFRDEDTPLHARFKPSPAGAGGGGKGGGGGGRTPVEDPDSLQSSAFAKVIDALSCGPIKGLVNGLESIYLDNVPIQNGVTPNFSGVEVAWRTGTQTQDYIEGFPSATNTAQVGVEVRFVQPALMQVTNVDADAFAVTVAVGAMTEQSVKTGDVSGSSVTLKVEYQPQNSSWIPAGEITITGKTRSRYQETHRYGLTGTGPWTVRVSRLTADSTTQTINNATFVDYMSSIVDLKLRYPMTALVGIKIDARQFGTIPTRSYDIEGMIIRVPNNYDPETRAYFGPWDGGFKLAYSNNPAWCLYEMLTNELFGLGKYMDPSQIPKDVLYTIGQYCDELVPDGYGGMEPRFTLNCVIQGEAQAYKVMQDLCSVFRGMTYWGGGLLVPVIDMPRAPTRKFSPANVVNGEFERTGSDRSARHSVALITWNNPEDNYRQATEYVEDRDSMKVMGYKPTDAVAFGCTSRGQANRLGKWILASERLETDQWAWGTGQEAATLVPGDIVQCTDPVYAGSNAQNPDGVRMGGRVMATTADTITLDAPVDIENGVSYSLYYVDSRGEDRTIGIINPGPGRYTELDYVSQLSDVDKPMVGDVWVLSALNRLQPELVRVLAVKESGGGVYSVTGTKHAPEKFAYVDFDTRLEPPPTGLGNGLIPNIPTNFSVLDTTFVSAPGTLGLKLFASWTGNTTAYQVRWRVNGGSWVEDIRNSPSIDILNVVEDDVYDFRIWGIGADGARSVQALEATHTVMGKSAPPGKCTNLVVVGQYKAVLATWVPPDDLDLDHVQIFENTVNDLSTAYLRGQASTTITLPLAGPTAKVGRYYWVRAVDTSGNVGEFNSSLGTYGETIPLYTTDFEGEIQADQLANDVVQQIADLVVEDIVIEIGPIIAEDAAKRVRGITVDTGLVTSDNTGVFAGNRTVYSDSVDNDIASAKKLESTFAQISDSLYAAIATEAEARATADEAMATEYHALVAQLNADTTAAIATEATVRANADGALATLITSLNVQVDDNRAAIQTEQTVRANADSALATSISLLTVKVDDNEAAIRSEQTARADGDQALAISLDQMRVRVDANEAGLQTESSVRANADSAMAVSITLLTSRTTDAEAAIVTEASTRANADTALATVQNSLVVRMGSVEVMAQDTTNIVAGIQGQSAATRTIKLQQTVGGVTYAASMGLGVYNNAGGVQTSIYFQADRFALLNVINGWTTTPFIIDSGITYIDIAMIKNLTVSTAKIADLAITNAKIANLAVDYAKIADLSVNNAKIVDGAITTLKVGTAQIDTLRIGAGAVTAGSGASTSYSMGVSSGQNVFTHTVPVPQGGQLIYFASAACWDGAGPSSGPTTVSASTAYDGTFWSQQIISDPNASYAENVERRRAGLNFGICWVGGYIGGGTQPSITLTLPRPSSGRTLGSVRLAILVFQR